MDMEWAKATTGELFIVQACPETVQARKAPDVLERYHLQQRSSVLVRGQASGEKIRHGPVRIIQDVHHLQTFQQGEVLVTDKTDPDWEPIMQRAAAIITNRSGRTTMPPLIAPSWACRPSWARNTAPASCAMGSSSRCPAPRARPAWSMTEHCRLRSSACPCGHPGGQ